MKAAIYTRVSSDEQIDGTSLDTQRERCLAFCHAKGWEVVEVFTDEGVSGAKSSRPSLDRLMAAARDGRVEAVVVYKTDRFSRSRAHLFSALEDLAAHRVAFTSVTESFDTSTTHGDAMVGMLGVFAQMERNLIRERTRGGVNARVRGGGWGGGHKSPYGYRIVGEGSSAHLEPDSQEAEVVRRAVSLVLDHGCSTLEAAKRLNALGMTPRTAALWTSQNLRNCLRRGQWAGTWTFGKVSPRGSVPEPIAVAVEPILEPERAAALQAYLTATTLRRGAKGVHPLSGRLVCTCGQPMTGIARSDRGTRRYRCRHGRHEPGRPFCGTPSLTAQAVDDAVWEKVLDLLTDPDRLMVLARERMGLLEASEAEDQGQAMEEAETAVRRAQEALASGAARCIAMGLDDATTAATLNHLRDTHAAAVRQRDLVAAVSLESSAARERMATAHQLADIARQRLQGAGPDLRAQVLAVLQVRATVQRNGENGCTTVELTGSVAHDLLLASVTRPAPGGVAPALLATAPG